MADRTPKGAKSRTDDLRLPPADPATERLVLGSVFVTPDVIQTVAALDPACFSTEALRRIHARMVDMQARGEPVDQVTLANELRKHGQLESAGGYSALIDLNDGLPEVINLESYVKILQDFAGRRRLIALGTKMVEDSYHGEQSAAEIVGSATATWQEIESQSGQTDDGGQTPRQIAESFPGGIDALMDPTRRAKGLPTGFTKFDEMTGGLHAGEVFIIGARPSMGKTALALNIAHHLVVNRGRRVVFFSLEMSKESLITRLVCSAARVDQMKFRAGYLNGDERRKLQVALGDITGNDNLTFYDISGITMPQMTKRIRRLYNDNGLDLVIVDYIGLIGSHRQSENRNQEMTEMSRQFKMLASELQIPFIVLSQLNRSVETRRGTFRPMLSDLRESGSIEQDADVVAFIFREELYKTDREDLRGTAELIIAKQRNGPIGTVNMRFMHQFTRFENRMDDLPPEE